MRLATPSKNAFSRPLGHLEDVANTAKTAEYDRKSVVDASRERRAQSPSETPRPERPDRDFWPQTIEVDNLIAVNERPLPIDRSDYVLVSCVTHPRGREMLFAGAFKAMIRSMIEVNDYPIVAYHGPPGREPM